MAEDLLRLRIAEIDLEVCAPYGGMRRLGPDYLVAEDAPFAPQMRVDVTLADIDRARSLSDPEKSWSNAYLETLAVLEALGPRLPALDRALFHGAVLEYGGRAFMFTAASGTGKSTHLRLWRRCLGEAVQPVNGDKPFLLIPPEDDAPITVFGTPWCGKEGWQRNVARPLCGICFLSRADAGESRIAPLAPADAVDRAVRQIYMPSDGDAVGKTLELLDRLLRRVPLYDFAADMSPDAVRVSFEALTGEDFEERRTRESAEAD